jgi:kynurenine formamidase
MGHTEEGIANHIAGLKLGMSWTEMLINLDQLPARGAYYQVLPPKIIDQGGSTARAIAFVPLQP